MSRRGLLSAISGFFALVAGCGAPPAPPAPVSAPAVTSASMITPSALVPIFDRQLEPRSSDPGLERYLIGGLRIVVHDGGRLERAAERFPSGGVQALALPERLGGGYVFFLADSQGTRLWRAESWTAPLTAMTFIGPAASELHAGFDRLYLRTRTGQVLALEAESGAIVPLGPLPQAGGYGAMAFADGWRAVVDTDLRGPLVTFDAGESWRPLPIEQSIEDASVIGGDPVVYVAEGWYRVDAQGQLQFLRYEEESAAEDAPETLPSADKPLGANPLRTAIAHGFPVDERTAVVAYRGGLARVQLPEGIVASHRPHVFESDLAVCTGVKLGQGVGFVCGVEDGPTTIHAYVPPLSVAPIARFEGPRFVASSGNGALVVRGKCSPDDAPESETRIYCIIDAKGQRREIAVRGELGSERVVALADGRTVVLVPPRLGRAGRLTIIAGDSLTSRDLVDPDDLGRGGKIAKSGLWLDGFQERQKGRISGWVEAGGPVVGVTVDVASGKLEIGEPREQVDQALVGGPLGLVVSGDDFAYETTDGGMSWREMELPNLPVDPRHDRLRGCTPVGCILRGWLRVGWGEPSVARDLELAVAPETTMVKPTLRDPLRLRCDLVASPGEPKAPPSVGERAPLSGWLPFQGMPPPRLGKDDLGVDKASQYTDETPTHVYAWGPKGADWTKTGFWQIRFDDRFRVQGISSSAPTRAPWADEMMAAEAIGAQHRSGYWRWDAAIDPSGKAAIANLCMGTRCLPYAVADGEPVVSYKATTAEPSYRRPLPHGVARVGESWFFLVEEPGGEQLVLWRGRLGIMEPAAQLRRLDRRRYPSTTAPRLVRRALGNELGILLVAPPDPSEGTNVGRWLVLPVDPERASLGEPIALGPADLGGALPPACSANDDGWLLETSLPSAPVFDLAGTSGYVDDVELRLRLEAGSACVEAIAARAGRHLEADRPTSESAAGRITMAVRERYTGRRWSFACGPR